MSLKKKELYNCYSLKLFHFLKEKRFYYLSKGVNENNGFNYWVFEKTGEFKNALSEWDKKKNSFK